MPTYTNNWFEITGVKNFSSISSLFTNKSVSGLEIGSFEGRSSNWIVENWCTNPHSKLTCIDPFTGSTEHSTDEKNGLYERFMENTRHNANKIRTLKQTSTEALVHLSTQGEKFDFAYIDGDHHNLSVMLDAILVDKLLKINGIIIFDDYTWGQTLPTFQRPKEAIDYFLSTNNHKYQIITSNSQVIATKTNA